MDLAISKQQRHLSLSEKYRNKWLKKQEELDNLSLQVRSGTINYEKKDLVQQIKYLQKEINEISSKLKNYRSTVIYQQEEQYIYE